jgi:hypothetical protein
VTFIPNPKLIEELNADPGVQAVLAGKAAEAAAVARSTAPDGTGAFRESITSEGHHLIATDPGALSIEYGTAFTAPHGTLRAAAEAVGGRIHGG